jgi:hypothetical protein
MENNYPRGPENNDSFQSAEKFSSAMDKIESAREGFLDRVKKSREMLYEEESELNDLTDEELMEIYTDFETDRIEEFLKKENDTTFINRAEYNRDDLAFEEPDASTLVDSKNKIFQRGESSSYSEDFDQKIDSNVTYRIGPLGNLEIMSESSHQTLPDKARPHPLEATMKLYGDETIKSSKDSPNEFVSLSAEDAKKIANFITSIASFIAGLYANPNLEIILSDNKTRYEIVDATEEQ